MDISEELCDVYISTGVVRVVKCRLGWAGYVARMDMGFRMGSVRRWGCMLHSEEPCILYKSATVVRVTK
jgi:hypothetical protein